METIAEKIAGGVVLMIAAMFIQWMIRIFSPKTKGK